MLDKEKEALLHAQNELKNRELHETEAKSLFHQKNAELIQSLDEEKAVRAKNEQELTESRQQLQALTEQLEQEKKAFANAKEEVIAFRQKEITLIQSLDEEREVRANAEKERDANNAKNLALDKDEILHQSKQEMEQLKKELEIKEQALHHVEMNSKIAVNVKMS